MCQSKFLELYDGVNVDKLLEYNWQITTVLLFIQLALLQLIPLQETDTAI